MDNVTLEDKVRAVAVTVTFAAAAVIWSSVLPDDNVVLFVGGVILVIMIVLASHPGATVVARWIERRRH